MRSVIEEHAEDYELECEYSGDAFLTDACKLSETLVDAIKELTGKEPKLSTTGGTSDARFIKDYSPVVEFGTTGFTPHKVNECVEVSVLEQLRDVYGAMLRRYYAG